MRLVLDTNVYLAALIARGTCHEVFEHCALQHALIVSDFILGEVEDNLRDKFRWPAEDVTRALALIVARSASVTPADLGAPVCRDHDDDAVLGTALAGDARIILSGDKDLLDLGDYRGVRILAPAGFWALEHTDNEAAPP